MRNISISGGNVGINTAQPESALDVDGEIQVRGGGLGPGDACDTTQTNRTALVADANADKRDVVLICDGSQWVSAAPSIAGACSNGDILTYSDGGIVCVPTPIDVPNPFAFIDQTDVPLGATIDSNSVTLTGFSETYTATCTNCTAIARNGVWGGTSVAGFSAGDTIAARVVASSSLNTAETVTVSVGGRTSDTWTVTTTGDTPNNFSFTDVTDATAFITYTSNPVILSGFTGTSSATCTNCTAIARNGVWGAPPVAGFKDGDEIRVRMTSPTGLGQSDSTTVSVGATTSDPWTITVSSGCAVGLVEGDACPDGTIYAGISPDGNVPMYTTPCDAHQYWDGTACTDLVGHWSGLGSGAITTYGTGDTLKWANGGGNLAYTDRNTGRANTFGIATTVNSSMPYEAAEYCYNLTAYGHSDWYLGALNEVIELYNHKAGIGNFDDSSQYWSSSEPNNFQSRANTVDMSNGNNNIFTSKAEDHLLRCVRR